MMNRPVDVAPDLISLFAQFPPADDLPNFELIHAEASPSLPPSFRALLAHEHHMTVTVEEYHADLVDVHLLASRLDGSSYTRKIILTLQHSGKVVLFGIVRINLDYCSPPVRKAILAGVTPLGRILIEHNVLRRIEVTAYLKIEPGPLQLQWFKLDKPQPLFGRLGFIYCDDQPAVELLEIVVDR
jgi:chorismate-pyruvate lyase